MEFKIKSSKELFAKVLENPTYAASVIAQILCYTADHGLPQPGKYRLAGLDLSSNLVNPMFFDTKLPFTKTECMIIRYLIRTYPRHTPPQEILKHAFREYRIPEIANVRTHISIINKKYREITNRNLIEQSFGAGYRVITPEVMANLV